MSEAEGKLISAICKNKDSVVLLSVDEQLFRSHLDIFLGLKSYYQKYKAIPDAGLLEEKFMQFDPVEVTGETEFYLNELKEDYIASNLRNILLVSGSALKTDSATRVLEQMQLEITKLSRMSNVCQDQDITDYESAIKEFDDIRMQASETGTVGIKSNIKAIDAVYKSGFCGGHLCLLLGLTAQGKTWMALYLAVQAWLQGNSVMVVSGEMNIFDVRNRVYGLLGSGIFSVSGLESGEFDEDVMREWGRELLDSGPAFTIIANENLGTVTPNIIAAKIDEYQPKFVVADYAQLFTDNAKTKQVTERFMNMIGEFKSLSMTANVPIVLLSAVTKDDNVTDDSPPPLSSVAWAKSIQYAIDLSLSVCRHKDTDIMEVYLQKNRRGPSAMFYLQVDLDRGKMIETYTEM